MSETTPTPDETPTEALQLADQQPVAEEAAVASTVEHRSHTRTILEVVGAVVAGILILGAGTVGFLVGHATGSDGHGDRYARAGGAVADGQAPGQGQQGQGRQGQGQQGFGMPGQQGQGQQGQGQQGFGMPGQGTDPDGDNWTGGRQMMPGQGGQAGQLPQELQNLPEQLQQFLQQFQGQNGGQGMPMMPGFGNDDQRGVDPDGDNWTGQNLQQAPQGQSQQG